MSHANARWNLHGRVLLVRRVRVEGRPVAHVAKEMGISRQCAHRWVARFDVEGPAGLQDRSSRPHSMPTRTSARVEAAVVACRRDLRIGRDRIAERIGVPARTVSRILARHQLPPLAVLDPVTGAVIRASRSTQLRYERANPGDLVHVDVKKLGRIPEGGGWRVHGRQEANQHGAKGRRLGFDYVHAVVDDRTRLAYAEIHPDEKGDTAAGVLIRAAEFFGTHGFTVREVLSDNALPTATPACSSPRSPASARSSGSSSRTAPGRTARSSDSTAPCRPNGRTGSHSPATLNEPKPLDPGSTTTTMSARTTASEGSPQRPARRHQPHDWVQLAALSSVSSGRGSDGRTGGTRPNVVWRSIWHATTLPPR